MALSKAKQAKVDRHRREQHVAGFEAYPDHNVQAAIRDYLATGTISEDYLPLGILERIRGRA
jgi:hypothetical protein